MAWLRIDDGFAQHPKIVQLTRKDRWILIEILLYCARYKTKGLVPLAVGEVVRGATPAFLKRCVELRLLDESANGLVVHDWDDYNGRDPKVLQAERQRKRRDNGVTSAVIKRDENVTHAQARARVPVPSPKEDSKESSLRERNPIWDALVQVFGEPSTDTARKLRGKVCSSLTRAGATHDDIIRRAKTWPRHFENATLTETALEKHWDALGRQPLRVER